MIEDYMADVARDYMESMKWLQNNYPQIKNKTELAMEAIRQKDFDRFFGDNGIVNGLRCDIDSIREAIEDGILVRY